MNEYQRIPLEQIDLGDRLRPVKPERVEVLAADIYEQGLLQPIVVAPAGERFVLVAGAYRLSAARALGWAEVPAIVMRDLDEAQRRFAEIMENVDRQELSKLERAEFLAELDAVWKELKAKARAASRKRSVRELAVVEREAEGDESPIFGLSEHIAEKVGLKRAAFFLALKIARDLTAGTKAALRGTALEDNQAELEKLAKLDAEVQGKVCDLLFADPPKADSVAEAVSVIEERPKEGPVEILYGRFRSTWVRLDAQTRCRFFDEQKDAFLAHAKSEGWI